MPDEKRPAIDKDVMNRPLGELNAVEFLSVLQQARLSPEVMAVLPDKKKYELWIDEGGLPRITVDRFLEKIRREKKKLELEKRLIVEHLGKRLGEFEIDRGQLINPVIREGLVSEIVDEVVRRVGG